MSVLLACSQLTSKVLIKVRKRVQIMGQHFFANCIYSGGLEPQVRKSLQSWELPKHGFESRGRLYLITSHVQATSARLSWFITVPIKHDHEHTHMEAQLEIATVR